MRMTTSPDTPAAQGTAKASGTENDNTLLEVEVRHLASPEKVAAGATTYVVWVRGSGQYNSQNLGALRVDDNLRATLRTVTPLKSFDVFITAEASPTATTPTNAPLLTASFRR
ncbi:MAG TPA: hypothetical protein VFZ73_13380 [Gemmatimonadaceae bacterium]